MLIDELKQLEIERAATSELKQKCESIKPSEVAANIGMFKELESKEIELQFIKQNIKILFFREKLPLVLSVLSKYNGKKYGPKTSEKIRLEIKERFNIGFYITTDKGILSYYKCEMVFYPLNDKGYCNGFSVYESRVISYDSETAIINRENYINVLPLENYKLSGLSDKDYIADTAAAAATVYEKYRTLKEMEKEFNNCISEYNSIIPEKRISISSVYVVKDYK